jgi:hypothetical protein
MPVLHQMPMPMMVMLVLVPMLSMLSNLRWTQLCPSRALAVGKGWLLYCPCRPHRRSHRRSHRQQIGA